MSSNKGEKLPGIKAFDVTSRVIPLIPKLKKGSFSGVPQINQGQDPSERVLGAFLVRRIILQFFRPVRHMCIRKDSPL